MEIHDLMNLKGRNALVTGGSQGIGKAIALGLAEYGANVIIHYHSNHEVANQTLEALQSFPIQSGAVAANLAQRESIGKISEYCHATLGHIDILVLNASIQHRRYWQDITYEEFEEQVNVNLRSTLFLIQQFVPPMRENSWGRVITIGSVQQQRPHPEMTVYSATKSAMENLVISLAPDLASDRITINNIAPGAIRTGRNEKVLQDKAYYNKVIQHIPLKEVGEPVDCAGICVLLASEAGRYFTGENIFVDGGMRLPT